MFSHSLFELLQKPRVIFASIVTLWLLCVPFLWASSLQRFPHYFSDGSYMCPAERLCFLRIMFLTASYGLAAAVPVVGLVVQLARLCPRRKDAVVQSNQVSPKGTNMSAQWSVRTPKNRQKSAYDQTVGGECAEAEDYNSLEPEGNYFRDDNVSSVMQQRKTSFKARRSRSVCGASTLAAFSLLLLIPSQTLSLALLARADSGVVLARWLQLARASDISLNTTYHLAAEALPPLFPLAPVNSSRTVVQWASSASELRATAELSQLIGDAGQLETMGGFLRAQIMMLTMLLFLELRRFSLSAGLSLAAMVLSLLASFATIGFSASLTVNTTASWLFITVLFKILRQERNFLRRCLRDVVMGDQTADQSLQESLVCSICCCCLVSLNRQKQMQAKTSLERAVTSGGVNYQALSQIAHDIRSPVGAIAGVTEILETDISTAISKVENAARVVHSQRKAVSEKTQQEGFFVI